MAATRLPTVRLARTGVHRQAHPTDGLVTERFASERLARYGVEFDAFSVPVVVYRRHLLGGDPFEVAYAVREPALLPGDDRLVEACKERIWEATVSETLGVKDRAAFVRERATTLLRRRLTARNTRAWLPATRRRVRSALAEYGFAVPPVDGYSHPLLAASTDC